MEHNKKEERPWLNKIKKSIWFHTLELLFYPSFLLIVIFNLYNSFNEVSSLQLMTLIQRILEVIFNSLLFAFLNALTLSILFEIIRWGITGQSFLTANQKKRFFLRWKKPIFLGTFILAFNNFTSIEPLPQNYASIILIGIPLFIYLLFSFLIKPYETAKTRKENRDREERLNELREKLKDIPSPKFNFKRALRSFLLISKDVLGTLILAGMAITLCSMVYIGLLNSDDRAEAIREAKWLLTPTFHDVDYEKMSFEIENKVVTEDSEITKNIDNQMKLFIWGFIFVFVILLYVGVDMNTPRDIE